MNQKIAEDKEQNAHHENSAKARESEHHRIHDAARSGNFHHHRELGPSPLSGHDQDAGNRIDNDGKAEQNQGHEDERGNV